MGFYSTGVAALAGGPTSELTDVAFVSGSNRMGRVAAAMARFLLPHGEPL